MSGTLAPDRPQDEPGVGTEDILAAYRAQREKRAREMASQDAAADRRPGMGPGPEDAPASAARPAAAGTGSPAPPQTARSAAPDDGPADQAPAQEGAAPAAAAHGAPPPQARQVASSRPPALGATPSPPARPHAGPSATQSAAPGTGTRQAGTPAAPGPAPNPASGPAAGPILPEEQTRAAPVYLDEITVASLGLEERVLEDKLLTRRGSPGGTVAGILLLLLGVLLVLADRRYVQAHGLGIVVTQAAIRVWQAGVLVAAVGLLALLIFLFVPSRRRPGFPIPITQREAWAWARASIKRLRVLAAFGWVLVAVCAAVAGYGVTVPDADGALLYIGLAAVLGLMGALTIAAAQAKRIPLRYLLAQTMLLAALEKAGVTLGEPVGRDERIGPVLRHLDRMLGRLPDDAVQAFLAAPEAKTYLRLMEEYAGS